MNLGTRVTTQRVSSTMGRHSSDSEDDSRSKNKKKKKQQRRCSSSSSSSSSSSGSRMTSSRSKRSTRRSRSRSRDKERDRRRRRRSSSSSSHGSSRRKRSRSADRDRGRSHRSHRSRSRDRRSPSRHQRSRSKSRKRSRSRERDHARRKGRDRDKDKEKERDRDKGRGRHKDKDRDNEKSKDKAKEKGDNAIIKAGLEHLTPAEQAKVRMHMVLQAAGVPFKPLDGEVKDSARVWCPDWYSGGQEGTSLEEQVRRIKDIEAIESDSFVPQAFKSSRDDIKVEPAEVKQEDPSEAPVEVAVLPTSIRYNDTDNLAHPSLFMDKEKAEELWLKRLVSLRQERLMGSPVT
ncbi:serine/Arginine-related protein 53 [Gadus chalcogrammus]|uniref:serine/Arginine-related protein 53 n=1 Tax=Gadus chalcogrammus TaxID=1042646 RepID=UPI0024C48374|nr:serine/Arginine-related protein 53 [Gadus chalcogrammus]